MRSLSHEGWPTNQLLFLVIYFLFLVIYFLFLVINFLFPVWTSVK